MLFQAGEKWNFTYILTEDKNKYVILVVPSLLHMGWTLSPAYLCTDTETERDLA